MPTLLALLPTLLSFLKDLLIGLMKLKKEKDTETVVKEVLKKARETHNQTDEELNEEYTRLLRKHQLNSK